jgi:hypothetical protein
MATHGRITLCYYEFNENLVPPYCMMTGERTDEVLRYRFYWMPWWTFLFLIVPIGLIAFIASMMTTFKTKRLLIPASSELRFFVIGRRLLFLFLLASNFFTVFALIAWSNRIEDNSEWWFFAFVGIATLMMHLINVIFVQNHKLHVIEIEKDSITFGGVHPHFIEMIRTTRGIRSRESAKSYARSEAE